MPSRKTPRRGRKPLMAGHSSSQITVVFPNPLLNKIDRVAGPVPGKRVAMIRELVELGLAARKRIARA